MRISTGSRDLLQYSARIGWSHLERGTILNASVGVHTPKIPTRVALYVWGPYTTQKPHMGTYILCLCLPESDNPFWA